MSCWTTLGCDDRVYCYPPKLPRGGVVELSALSSATLEFIKAQRLPEAGIGRYRYAEKCSAATLYSSCYAAMTRSLYGDLASLEDGDRTEWIAYLNAHQDDDGLYRDPVIYGQGLYTDDPLWCGRPHLTCHVITALAALGAVSPRPLRWLDAFTPLTELRGWLESRDWGEMVAFTGNEIMNVGTLLQYARDMHGDSSAGQAVTFMLDWLEANHLDSKSGVWGDVDVTDPFWRSHAVQAAYHWWTLFAYDRRPFPCAKRAIDTLLATQNPLGGFGWGVHNPEEPWISSACEDIDSIEPLVRLSTQTSYRRSDIRATLDRAADWVMRNRLFDGGFAFCLYRPFTYGHAQMESSASMGAMFPTWFRTLSLAYIGTALPRHGLGRQQWEFLKCPGFQFLHKESA